MFKDATPTYSDMVANIIAIFQSANHTDVYEGTHWYDSAREYASYLASRHGVSVDVAACVIAAHSKNARWNENMRRAELQLAGTPTGFKSAIVMSNAAIDYGTSNLDPFQAIIGPKINPFARNVAGQLEYVATDRWAQRAAFNTLIDKDMARWIKRDGVRDDMIRAYQYVAKGAGVAPAVMQAIVWVVIRGSAE